LPPGYIVANAIYMAQGDSGL